MTNSLFSDTHHGRIHTIIRQFAAHPVHCIKLRKRAHAHAVQHAGFRLALRDLRFDTDQRELGADRLCVIRFAESTSLQTWPHVGESGRGSNNTSAISPCRRK